MALGLEPQEELSSIAAQTFLGYDSKTRGNINLTLSKTILTYIVASRQGI